MTALAVALVLCCAMVCGLRVYGLRHNERIHQRAQRSDAIAGVQTNLESTVEALRLLTDDHARLRTEVEQLRASSAFRSIS